MYPEKDSNSVMWPVIALVALLLGGFVGHEFAADAHARETNEWRKAAAPVFAARGVPKLAKEATPANLRNALDVNVAMVWHEKGKLSAPHRPTKISIGE